MDKKQLSIFEDEKWEKEWWEDDWEGMPEYISEDLTPYRSIIVHFENKEDLEKFSKLVKQNITSMTKYIYFPKATIEIAKDKIYKSIK